MMKYLIFIFIVIAQILAAPSQGTADIYNPKPYPDDFILPMPGGSTMAFRPVFIGEGDKPFALKEFKLGDRAGGGYKEYPTPVVVGGAFVMKNPHGQPDWMYYIGKYEVTEVQYYALMQPGTKSDSQEPITEISWFDVQEFLNKYNIWLFENAKDNLPKNEEAFGFLRLPTEIEWEFAARGGSEVESGQFDKKHPYPDPLSRYEWFEGPKSSHGKINKTGMLEPNDLKIHDMLGNVAEMTGSLYQLEYYQGRTGGFVSRGGHCFTSEDKIRSSLREEVPYYKLIGSGIVPTKQKTLGFRILISSQIYASRQTSQNLASAWEDYVNSSRKTPVAGPVGLPQTTVNLTNVQLSDALKSLENMASALNSMVNIPQSIWDQMGLLNASFTNVQSTVKKAEYDSAFAWVKVASETAYLIYSREMKELPAKQKALEMAKEMGKSALMDSIGKQIEDKLKNIEDGLSSYGFSFVQLEKISEDSVKEGFERYRQFLSRRGASEQIRFTELVKQHYQEYFKNRRLDIDKWRADLEKYR